MADFIEVAIDLCRVDTFENSRKSLGDLTSLVDSIKANGIQEPLLGKAGAGDDIEIFVGFRRFAAAQKAGLKKIPVMVHSKRSIKRDKMLVLNLVENVQRKDLNPIDEALGYVRLKEEHGFTDKAVCEAVGIKRTLLTSRLRLLVLGDVVRLALQESRIGPKAAFEIDRLPGEKQGKYVEIAENLGSGIELENKINKELENIQKKASGGTKTKVTGDDDGSGEAAAVSEFIKRIKQAGSVMCHGLGYEDERRTRVRDVNFRTLQGDDLQVVTQLFDDVADSVPEDAPEFNDKAQTEIEEMVANTPDGRVLAFDSELVQRVILEAVRSSAMAAAVEAAKISGQRPKVTFAQAQDAIDEFYGDVTVEGNEVSDDAGVPL